jgi:hypothetical protein
MTTPVDLDDLLTNKQCAALLKIKATSLEIKRIRGTSPPYIKLGTSKQAPIRYLRSEVMKWLAEQSYASTSAHTAAVRAKSHNCPPSRRSSDASA